MYKIRKAAALVLTSGLLVGATAGVASAKSESWAGVKPATSHWTGAKLSKVQHAKPARGENWTGESWLGKRPASEVWS